MPNESLILNDKKAAKVIHTIKSYFGWFGVIIISVSYLLFSMLDLVEKDATFQEILLRTALSFFIGFSINRMLDIQGINAGLDTLDFKKADKEHKEEISQLGSKRKETKLYCKYLNETGLQEAREAILSLQGLDYDDYFDKKGKFIGTYFAVNVNLEKEVYQDNIEKNKCIKRSIRHKVTQITPSSLLSDDTKSFDPNYLGKTLGDYTFKTVSMDVVMKLAPAFIIGRIGVEFASGVSWSGMIFTMLELSFYTLLGFIKYYSAFNFITRDYVQRIVNKTSLIRGLKDFVPVEQKEVKDHAS